MNPNKLLNKVKIWDYTIHKPKNIDFLISWERLYLQVVNSNQPIFIDSILIQKFKDNGYVVENLPNITKEEIKNLKDNK